MTQTPASTTPATPTVAAGKPRRRLLLVGLAALVVAGGVSIPLIRAANRPFDLDMAWGVPGSINVGAAGDPLAAFKAGLAGTSGTVEFGALTLDPSLDSVLDFDHPVTAKDAVAGKVPTWFPTLDGAVNLSSRSTGEVEAGDPGTSTYTATQVSLLATDRTAAAIGEKLTDQLDEIWPEVTQSPGDHRHSLHTGGDSAGRTAELDIQLDTSPAFPGLLIVQVDAQYTDDAPLRQAPQELQGGLAQLAVVAASSGWTRQAWALADGVDRAGAAHRTQSAGWRAAGGDVVAIADAVVAELGIPADGDVTKESASLYYRGGAVHIAPDRGTTKIRWDDESTADLPPGPLGELKTGVPVATADLGAKPIAAATQRGEFAMGDAIAKFEQAGMPLVEGAVAVRVESGARVHPRSSATERTALQVVVVDTALSPDEVSKRLQATLADVGVTVVEAKDRGTTLSRTLTSFAASTPGRTGAGEASYVIAVGSLADYPKLVAVSIEVTADSATSLPAAPGFAASYFKQAGRESVPSWTKTRWFISHAAAHGQGRARFRGEVEWIAEARGPAGLDATVSAIDRRAGGQLEQDSSGAFQQNIGGDGWRVWSASDDTYSLVGIAWQGAIVDAETAG